MRPMKTSRNIYQTATFRLTKVKLLIAIWTTVYQFAENALNLTLLVSGDKTETSMDEFNTDRQYYTLSSSKISSQELNSRKESKLIFSQKKKKKITSHWFKLHLWQLNANLELKWSVSDRITKIQFEREKKEHWCNQDFET